MLKQKSKQSNPPPPQKSEIVHVVKVVVIVTSQYTCYYHRFLWSVTFYVLMEVSGSIKSVPFPWIELSVQ